MLTYSEPGGYLQWDEIDNTESSVVIPEPGSEAPAMEKLRQFMAAPSGSQKPEE